MIRKVVTIFILVVVFSLQGIPVNFISNVIRERNIIDTLYWSNKNPNVIDIGLSSLFTPGKVNADSFNMQTGYYIGNGVDERSITNIGFQPDLVFVKDATTVGQEGMLWKSSVMPSEVSAKLGEAETDAATNMIQSLDSTGFTVGSDNDVNSTSIAHYWMAFSGSDCTSTGTFCVGSYTGDGGTQDIDTGFQPDLVIVKRSGTSFGVWKSSAMAANETSYFTATATDTSSNIIQTLDATSFSVGSHVNVNANSNNYWFVAFKEVDDFLQVGSYTGDGTDNRIIDSDEDSGLDFEPNLVFIKNSNSGAAVFNISESYGDRSFVATDGNTLGNNIQELLPTGGYQIGSASTVNGSGNTMYYAAFAGALDHQASGTFTMANGSYSGNGASQSISGIGFDPDLVIIKHNDQATDQFAVFKTKVMANSLTAYFANSTTSFSDGITLGIDNFSVGSHETVNASGDTYYWTAFGNAWDHDDHTGADDFVVGAYVGDGADNKGVSRLPFQPDLITIKRNGSSLGVWRTSDMTGDSTIYFSATNQRTNLIQQINPDGFQRGSNSVVNTAGNIYWYFGFRSGTNFTVNNYTGNGSGQDITNLGFQPDLIFTKKATGGTNRGGILKTSSQNPGDSSPFLSTPSSTVNITAIIPSGFSVGTGNESNENTFTYRFAAWRIPPDGVVFVDIVDSAGDSVTNPSILFNTVETVFECTSSTAIFGSNDERIRITNESSNPLWSLTISADNGIASVWHDGGIYSYDFNDSGGGLPGCTDSGDTDSYAGLMSFDFSNVVVTPKAGCSNTGITIGSASNFEEGTADNVVIISANGSADIACYWEITGIEIFQTIPSDQGASTYTLPMSLTVIPI